MTKNKTPSGPPPDPKLNRMLASLPAKDYARLLPDLELVEMPLGWTMSESGDHVHYLHFPTSGIVSLIYSLEDGSSSETALVGNEGLVGISIFMGG
ncbi:MAG: Crp/Fnr family transcriptional regulator, partial [Zoogloea sp.]|nr:Crp/Fnr family transcriptional regulator [Zoogloea sp.]